jgi:Alpha/beta hydrolase family
MAIERVIDIYVRNWRRRPAMGARVTFALDGETVGEVPYAEGHASLRLPDRQLAVRVVAALGAQTRQFDLPANQDTLTIEFGVPRWIKALTVSALLAGATLFLLNKGLVPVGDPTTITSTYVEPGPRNSEVVVVFVHGLMGSDRSWANDSNSFPTLLATDAAFRDRVDVFVFEFYTPPVGVAPSLVDLADQLRIALTTKGVLERHQKLVFVAHSMGGLVARRWLLSNRDLLARIPFIFLYASPTNGADLAAIAKVMSANPQSRGLTPVEDNDLLQSIHSDWTNSAALQDLPTYCPFETLLTSGVMVVPRSSATALCNGPATPITADHIGIVKPTDRNDARYATFAAVLMERIAAK